MGRFSVRTFVHPSVRPSIRSPLWAIHPGLRPSQPGLRPSQPSLKPETWLAGWLGLRAGWLGSGLAGWAKDWLAGPQAWLAGPQALLDGPEGGTDERTNKISPFYRTSSPIGAAAQKGTSADVPRFGFRIHSVP